MNQRIAIIGAGPAGLAAADEALRQGMKAILFEKGQVGEGIRCAEGFFDPFRSLAPPEAAVRFKVQSLYFRAEKEYEFSAEGLRLWIIDRAKWQQHWAETLKQRGVEIREHQFISRRNYARLREEFDWVIDASGVPPVTSLVYGFRDYYLPHSLVTAQYVLSGDFSHLRDGIKVGFSPDYLGYFWIFPKTETKASAGIALLAEEYGHRDLNLLWTWLRREIAAAGLAEAGVIEKGGGLCPAKMLPRLVWGNVILAGDAAGLTSPLHGGGIDMALLSGREAAGTIARGEVQDYRERLEKIFKPRLELERELVRLWAGSSFGELERVLAGVHNLLQGKGIGPLLPLSRDLLQKAYLFFRFWRGLQKGFARG
ncbi:MAG TPA: NAD(P)/FAD-dependent oxidoreductase [Firmicutes bacterium]|jgi:digeranylgeranylglycerophospholipid reductase|nr:NAD(P)/FAD-dependent oxidoreductase [Bacillota bacterium]